MSHETIQKSKEIDRGNQCAPKSLLKKLQNNPESENKQENNAAHNFKRSFETQIGDCFSKGTEGRWAIA